MEPTKTLSKSPSGAAKLKTFDEFKGLAEAEYQLRFNAMVDEYRDRKQSLAQSRDRKIQEYAFMNLIISANTASESEQLSPEALIKIETELAALDFDSVCSSFTLQYWRTQLGEETLIITLCDLMKYFFRQFQVKETISDQHIIHLSIKLLATHPKLRIRELVYILNSALQGKYGPTYQRIGIDSFLGWINQFLTHSSEFLECRLINSAPEASLGDAPWRFVEEKLKKYKQEQAEKKRINEEIWGIERNKRAVADYKNGLNEAIAD